jgi:hypothetical protein
MPASRRDFDENGFGDVMPKLGPGKDFLGSEYQMKTIARLVVVQRFSHHREHHQHNLTGAR